MVRGGVRYLGRMHEEAATNGGSAGRHKGHAPVLLAETLKTLQPAAGETYLDATAGLGGHAIAFGARVHPGGRLILNDLDAQNLAEAEARVRAGCPGLDVELLRGNFAEAPRRVSERGWAADVVLADLGFASTQVDDGARGFSFKRDGPLDMRYGGEEEGGATAADLVAELDERELAGLIWEFGEERRSRPIARAIVRARSEGPIETTGRLGEIVLGVGGASSGGVDGATRTVQALRSAVNDEMGSLDALLAAVTRGAAAAGRGEEGWLSEGARVGGRGAYAGRAGGPRGGGISFHSLEDRRVKRAFAAMGASGTGEVTPRKAVEASSRELSENARARSAKLRVVRIVGPM